MILKHFDLKKFSVKFCQKFKNHFEEFHFSDVQLRRNTVNIYQNIELEFKIKFKNYLDGMREFMNTTSLSNATLV